MHVEGLANNLIELKYISENLFEKREIINQDIKESLKLYEAKNKGKMIAISDLANLLKESPLGNVIISENSLFNAYEKA